MRFARIVAGLSLIASSLSYAATPAEQLAIDSYRHLVAKESQLDGAIRSGERADLEHFILGPTRDLALRWPPLGDAEHDRYRRCQFALNSFVIFAGDQYAARGKLPPSSPAKMDYFAQKESCRKAIKGLV